MTTTYSCNAPSYDELGGRAIARGNRCNLDDNTNNHDKSTEEDGVASTETVTKGEDEASAQKAANSVDRGNKSLPRAVAINFGEVGNEGRRRDDTGHYTLIVTKEQKIGGCQSCDVLLECTTTLGPVGRNAMGVVLVSSSHWHQLRHLVGVGSSTVMKACEYEEGLGRVCGEDGFQIAFPKFTG